MIHALTYLSNGISNAFSDETVGLLYICILTNCLEVLYTSHQECSYFRKLILAGLDGVVVLVVWLKRRYITLPRRKLNFGSFLACSLRFTFTMSTPSHPENLPLNGQTGVPSIGQKRKRLPRASLACESCRARKAKVLFLILLSSSIS